MQFGVCGDMKMASIAACAGFDYAEWSVPDLLKPQEPEEAFQASLEAIRAAALPYPVSNGFVPGELKITGPDADLAVLETYVATAMARAERAGVEVIVFGSGGARRIPEGFDRQVAHDQLVAFCQMVGPLAQDHGVTVVVEPLNVSECNVLTTVGECGRLLDEVAHPAIRLLVDGYHLMHDDDPYESIVEYGAQLAHVHIAANPNRRAPGAEECDLSPFFAALAKAQYTGRVSIEGRLTDPESELGPALELMRGLV